MARTRNHRSYTYVPVATPRTRRSFRVHIPWRVALWIAFTILAALTLGSVGVFLMLIIGLVNLTPVCPRHSRRCGCRDKVTKGQLRRMRKARRAASRPTNPNHPYGA